MHGVKHKVEDSDITTTDWESAEKVLKSIGELFDSDKTWTDKYWYKGDVFVKVKITKVSTAILYDCTEMLSTILSRLFDENIPYKLMKSGKGIDIYWKDKTNYTVSDFRNFLKTDGSILMSAPSSDYISYMTKCGVYVTMAAPLMAILIQ
jgi:hypothetical protein